MFKIVYIVYPQKCNIIINPELWLFLDFMTFYYKQVYRTRLKQKLRLFCLH